MDTTTLVPARLGQALRITAESIGASGPAGALFAEPLGLATSLFVPWRAYLEVFHLPREILKISEGLPERLRFSLPLKAVLIEGELSLALLFERGPGVIEGSRLVGTMFELIELPACAAR